MCSPTCRSDHAVRDRALLFHEIFGTQDEHAVAAALELEPREGQRRPCGRGPPGTAARLDDEHAVRLQEIVRGGKDAADEGEPVGAGDQPESRLVPILRRQCLHLRVRRVGWIAHDEIVASAAEPLEQVAADQVDAFFEPVTAHVLGGDFERAGRDVRRIDTRIRKRMRARDGDAAAPGAHVQHAPHSLGLHPWREVSFDQLGDRRARDEHSLVDMEVETGEASRAREIRRGRALDDTALEQRDDGDLLRVREPAREQVIGRVVVEAERVEHEHAGLVGGVVRAMAEVQARRVEAARAEADEVHRRGERGQSFFAIVQRSPGVRRDPYDNGPVWDNRLPMTGARILLLGALALVAAGAGVAAGVWYSHAGEGSVRSATVLDVPRAVPEYHLIDEHGSAATRADLDGRWTILFFGFTHCPDVCPMTLQVLARALRSLDDLDPGRRPTVRFVSVDPQRDTPERLAQYLAFFDADLHGLTGEEAEIEALTRALGVAYSRVESPDGGDYTMDHTAALFVVDPQARLHAVFTPPYDARTLATDLRAIIRRAAS